MHIYVHIRIYLYTYIFIYTYTCIYVYTSICARPYMLHAQEEPMKVARREETFIHAYVMHTYIYTIQARMYTYTYIYTCMSIRRYICAILR